MGAKSRGESGREESGDVPILAEVVPRFPLPAAASDPTWDESVSRRQVWRGEREGDGALLHPGIKRGFDL